MTEHDERVQLQAQLCMRYDDAIAKVRDALRASLRYCAPVWTRESGDGGLAVDGGAPSSGAPWPALRHVRSAFA